MQICRKRGIQGLRKTIPQKECPSTKERLLKGGGQTKKENSLTISRVLI